MKLTKYEYLKYVFVFANLFGAVVVYFFMQNLVERGFLKLAAFALPITLVSAAFMALSSYVMFRISPAIKQTKEQTVDNKYIAQTIIGFIIAVVGAYFILNNPEMLFPSLGD